MKKILLLIVTLCVNVTNLRPAVHVGASVLSNSENRICQDECLTQKVKFKIPNVKGKPGRKRIVVAGAFDGHADFGEQVAKYIKDNIAAAIIVRLQSKQRIKKAIRGAVQAIEEQVLQNFDTGGTTMTLLVIYEGKAYVANSGDSRTIAFGDRKKFVTQDHTANLDSERARIYDNGGAVVKYWHVKLQSLSNQTAYFVQKYDCNKQQVETYEWNSGLPEDVDSTLIKNFNSTPYDALDDEEFIAEMREKYGPKSDVYADWYVLSNDNMLNFTRSIGDKPKKINEEGDVSKAIVATPDIYELSLKEYHTFILVTDGVTDRIGNDDAIKFVQKKPQKTCVDLAKCLCDSARFYKSSDDIGAVVVRVTQDSN